MRNVTGKCKLAYYNYYHVLQPTGETFCFADGLFLSNQPMDVWNQCDDLKMCRFIYSFVRLKMPTPLLLVNCRIIIHMSDERAWYPLQENKAVLKKLL